MKNNRHQLNLFQQYKDLFKRIGFTLGILGIYKIISCIVIPGVNLNILSSIVNSSSILKSLDLYSGGSLEKCSILSLSVSPYINASILMQLLSSKFGGIDALMKLKEEGEMGKQKIAEYTQYLSLLFSIIYATTYSLYTAYQVMNGIPVVFINRGLFIVIAIPSLVAGAVFTSWLGGLIQKNGIGNGVSVIMCANIIARLPKSIKGLTARYVGFNSLGPIIATVICIILMVGFIIYLESTVRNVQVRYTSQGQQIYNLPIKFDNPGIMTTIFAGQVSSSPQIILSLLINAGVEASVLKKLVEYMQTGSWINILLQIFLIMYFTFICSEFAFNSEENARNLHESGGVIHGIRPGAQTAEFFNKIINKINYLTGIYLAIVCVLFDIIGKKFNLTISGSSMLIMITTIMEVIRQCYAYFLSKQQYSLMSTMYSSSYKL
jgi:preprotein translocase subunit SecY